MCLTRAPSVLALNMCRNMCLTRAPSKSKDIVDLWKEKLKSSSSSSKGGDDERKRRRSKEDEAATRGKANDKEHEPVTSPLASTSPDHTSTSPQK